MTQQPSHRLQTHEELHAMTNHELAQLLDCDHDHARGWIDRLREALRRHLRDCGDGRVVVTDTGLLALWRVRGLERLCLEPDEVVARVEAELPSFARPVHDAAEANGTEAQEAPSAPSTSQALALREQRASDDPESGWSPAQRKLMRATLAGIGGTGAMSILGLVGPLVGLPLANVGAMLTGFVGQTVDPSLNVPIVGWALHFGIGVVLGWLYVYGFRQNLAGPGLVRGAAYGLLPWLLAQVIVMPVMGNGIFAMESGSPAAALNSLLDHIVYGAVLGALFGSPLPSGYDGAASADPADAR